jgi:hypothetical protein
LDPAGNSLYSTTFGDQVEEIAGVAIDSAGNAYVAGTTGSPDFPVTSNAAQSTFSTGSTDAFLAIVNSGGQLTYASYVGEGGDDVATGVAVDSQSRVVISGNSRATPPTGFLVRLERPGAHFQPIASFSVDAVAIGPDESIYAHGVAASPEFPATGPPLANLLNSAPQGPSPWNHVLLRVGPETLQPIYAVILGSLGSGFGNYLPNLQVRPDGASILRVREDDSFPHRAPLYMGGGAFWTEVAPDGSALRHSGVFSPIDPGGLAVLAPDGTMLTVDHEGRLFRGTIPPPPEISLDHVANAFSGVGSGVWRSALYSLTGSGIGPDVPIWLGLDAADPPVELGGVRVLFNNAPARLLYVSADRILCIAGAGWGDSSPIPNFYSIHVEFGGKSSNFVLGPGELTPGLLTTAFPDVSFQAYAENPDGSLNGPENPVAGGSPVTLYETGSDVPFSFWCGPENDGPWPWTSNSATPVSAELDRRFAASIYRVKCTAPPQPGPVAMGLIVHSGHPGFDYSIGNFVTIYVK